MQITGKGVRYSGVVDCLVKTLQAEGLRGLYKGWLPNWLRIGCVNQAVALRPCNFVLFTRATWRLLLCMCVLMCHLCGCVHSALWQC